MKSRRVVCVGNALCTDDGVALAVAEALEARTDLPQDVEILRVPEFGLSCLDAFRGVAQVVVIDAVAMGAPPGTCSVLENPELLPRASCSVGHATSLTALLELVEQLDAGQQTPSVTVVGIEAGCLAPFCTTLTPAVHEAIPKAVELVMAQLLTTTA